LNNPTAGRTSPAYLARRLRRAFAHEIWNIGVVEQSAADIAARGIVAEVRWLPHPPRRTMLADPACRIGPDGALHMFAEYLDYRTPRGEIWHAVVAPGADPCLARWAPLIRETVHLSYPVPFEDEAGETWLAAESWQSGGVPLWRMQQDRVIRAEATWLRGRQPVDPTLLRHEGRWFLFCTFHDDAPDARLHLFHADHLDGNWSPVAGNPARTGLCGSRPAGPVFAAGDQLIRPAQDCSVTYGGGIVLQRIRRLDPGGYAEETIRRLAPVPGRYGAGLHTLCPAGAVTLIDGKAWQADFTKPLRRLQQRWLHHDTVSAAAGARPAGSRLGAKQRS
jgi:hypothetical protein